MRELCVETSSQCSCFVVVVVVVVAFFTEISAFFVSPRYTGHASHVTSVRFSADDAFLVSAGGDVRFFFFFLKIIFSLIYLVFISNTYFFFHISCVVMCCLLPRLSSNVLLTAGQMRLSMVCCALISGS